MVMSDTTLPRSYPTYEVAYDFSQKFFHSHGFRDIGAPHEPVEFISEKSGLEVMLGYVLASDWMNLGKGHLVFRPTPLYIGLKPTPFEIIELQPDARRGILLKTPEIAAQYLAGLEETLRTAKLGMMSLVLEKIGVGSKEWGGDKSSILKYRVDIQSAPTP